MLCLFGLGGGKNKMAFLKKARKGLQKDKTSVYVVEDHNEVHGVRFDFVVNVVLRGIYREIGSKRLPMTGCVLLHLDSHSDMSIPKNLKTDDIFDKESLFSILSIENWIVPAAFAGHIDTVVWIKPQWTKESFERFSAFSVGQHITSGEIRVSSKSNYFLSELSFAPEWEMVDCKPLNLFVLPIVSEVATIKSSVCLPSSAQSSCSESGLHNQTVIKFGDPNVALPIGASSKFETTSSQKGNFSSESCSGILPNNITSTEFQKSLQDLASSSERSDEETWESSDKSSLQLNKLGFCQNSISKEINVILHNRSDGFILDIDLDFFSTADPLQTMLTAKQQTLFKALYRYTPPTDSSDESVSACLAMRQEQISYLGTVLRSAQNNETLELGDSQRDHLIQELLADLKTSQALPEAVDFEWLHEIGTGIDDCELPHHISSQEEICKLVGCVEAMLQDLPKPAVITIARSSSDDYCPVHQVDFIECRVLEMLSRVYSNLDVKLTYEQ